MKQESTDLYLCAFVMAKGVGLAGTRRQGRQVLFSFDIENEQWDALRRDFHSGEGEVRGLSMANATKALKSLISIT